MKLLPAKYLAPVMAASLAVGYGPAAFAQEAEAALQADQTAIQMRADQVVALINGDLDQALEDVFTPAFLAEVPPMQLAALAGQLTAQFGPAITVENLDTVDGPASAIEVRMERAIAKGTIAIDPAQGNLISGLFFQSFEPVGETPAKISADLQALPGTANALLAKIGADGAADPVFAHNPAEQLALGSAFKLYVLSALANSIAAGERAWDDTVLLNEKSLPSGMMQNWPNGAPVTLQTLATMMISISDNTATDQLIAEMGRETVEAELVASGNSDPSKSVPFLTTRELFSIRGASEEFNQRYLAASDEEQRTILDNLSEDDFSMEATTQRFAAGVPGALGIEWYASPEDLARLMHRIRSHESPQALDVMAVNPQLTGGDLDKWDYAGFKGGSEPGVLNLTWLLTDTAGDDWILSVGWNNPDAAVETATLQGIALRILALVP